MKTLNGYKLEKALIGVIDKGRGREPGYEFGYWFHINRMNQEIKELVEILETDDIDNPEYYENAMREIADVSNFCDFLADRLIDQYARCLKPDLPYPYDTCTKEAKCA